MRSPSSEAPRNAARQQALHLLNSPHTPPRGRPWRKAALVGAIALALALGLVAGRAWFTQPAAAERASAAEPQANTAAPVEPAPPAAAASAVTAAGFIKASRLSTVSAEITGTVQEIYVQRGDKVKKGERLASLDGRSLRAQLASLQASQQIAAGKLAQTESRLPRARNQLQRLNRLLPLNYVSQDDVDSAKAELDSFEAQRRQYQAELQQVGWQIKASEIDLLRTIIRAPFDGQVVSLDASPGETVSPISAGGGFTRTGIATIVGLDNFDAEVWLPESQLAKVTPQQRVTIKPDGLPDRQISGTVSLISSVVDEQRAAVLVIIKLAQQQPWLKHNMSIQVDFYE
ncbi:efflux RND transporter periplasmic adaptor subunit [Serratia ureilytica]|uniref:efflux RND transporter periplasmic adaptor subunit n=1 Tax=Serratia ureilytica TaxID=300181 RepID=UPI0018E74491|nr:efflux RND transporter periplasmic adaptor subunit [Serratia ureilytica]MBJ2114252.1 efflux RND transporter periplasmic adaptor subunit [Serratia ureilytica]